MKIGELAVRAGLTVDTIRYYERRGLLPRAARTGVGYRTYSGTEVERLSLIKFLQGLGVSLEQITDMLRMLDDGKATCANQRPTLDGVVDRIDQEIDRLRETRRTIIGLLASCKTGQCSLAGAKFVGQLPPTLKRRSPPTARHCR